MKKLALFDLDNTLISGDSDHLWGLFLAEKGIVDQEEHTLAQDKFYQQYVEGILDIHEFLEFQFTPLKENSMEDLLSLRDEYIDSQIKPIVEQSKIDLVKHHQDLGHTTIIITATNSFITRPIADLFGIKTLIATEPEQDDSGFTGKLDGIPCFQSGKIEKLNQFLGEQTLSDFESWFYSDSHNDLPLLMESNHPIAVNSDEKLRSHAIENSWKIID